ncbi:MAG: DUF3344 domain-containing protein [Euryarchaeota archaeon]|nr:DUF3344 domain-containing protein [Euryarchaeota archaeon]
MKTNISLVYIVILMAMVVPASAAPDLSVESVTLDCGYLFGNESNGISAKITTNDTGCGSFNVSFVLSDGFSIIESVDALASGNNTTVNIIDPTIRNAGAEVTITVTADCYGEIAEGNESNNATTLNAIVVNNGYKGKTYTGGENITTWKTFDLNGDLIYSAGDSYYLSAYTNKHWTEYLSNWTASDLPVPAAATVVGVRLHILYTWAKAGVMPDEVSLDFNGIVQTRDAHYCDEKMYGTSYPYGMLAYNVTDDFNTDGNSANLTNSHSGGGNVSMRGMMLVVTYEDASEPRRQIFANEGFDLLYGGSGQCTTPEEATAWAPITGLTIDLSTASARLITYAPGAGRPDEGELIFNGQVWTDEWNDNGIHQIGISDRVVTAHLKSTGNVVGFQSSGDYMEASNAYLVVNYVPGDVTGDGVVNIGDATLLFNWVSFPNEREGIYALDKPGNADVTGNGAVNIGDATLLFNWVSFPDEQGTTYVLK